jgi:pimeloyl-ACP methyl ester carboxylesterase
VPRGVEQAENDAATFFEIELASIGSWTFGAEQARSIACPVLSVNGTASGPLFDNGRDQLHAWLPQCCDLDINGANHFLPMLRPQEIATAVADFLTTAAPRACAPEDRAAGVAGNNSAVSAPRPELV